MNKMVAKFTNKHLTFKLSPCGRFYSVKRDGRSQGFIWNCDKEIRINGELVNCKEFFN
jgi:hypothetical protein